MKSAGMVLGYIFIFIIAKFYNAEILGSFIIAIIILTVASMISTLGLDTALVSLIARYKSLNDFKTIKSIIAKSYVIILSLSCTFTLLLYFLSIAHEYLIPVGPEFLKQFRILLPIIIFISFIKLNAEVLRGLKMIASSTLINNVATYLFAIILLLLLNPGMYNPEKVVIAYLVAVFLVMILSFIYIIFYVLSRKGGESKEIITSAGLIKYSVPILYSDLLNYLKTWIGTLLIGYFLIESLAGIYSIALKLAAIPGLFIFAVNSIAMPKYSESYFIRDKNELQHSLSFSTKIIFYLSLPSLAVILIIARPLFSFLGGEYNIGFLPLSLLLLAQLIESLAGSANYLLIMVNKQKIYSKIILAGTILLASLSALMIPIFNLTGAALAVLITSIFQTSILVYYIKTRMKLNPIITSSSAGIHD